MLRCCLMVQAFARLSAVYGGTYMLNKPECKVVSFFFPSPSIMSESTNYQIYSFLLSLYDTIAG